MRLDLDSIERPDSTWVDDPFLYLNDNNDMLSLTGERHSSGGGGYVRGRRIA